MKKLFTLFIAASLLSCNTIKKNMDSNYRVKSGKAAAEKAAGEKDTASAIMRIK